MTLAQSLRLSREKAGLNRRQAADQLGMAYRQLQHYEAGTHAPGIEILCRMADIYGVTLDSLVGRTPPYCCGKRRRKVPDGQAA